MNCQQLNHTVLLRVASDFIDLLDNMEIIVSEIVERGEELKEKGSAANVCL